MKTGRLVNILTILAVTTLVAACNGGGGGSTSLPPEPELVVLAGNINGAVITDANGQEFAITAKGRKLYEIEKRRELANTSVSDDNRRFFVNGVEEGIIVLAQQPVAGVSAIAEASEGDGVAVFGRAYYFLFVSRLDIETGTDANSEVTAVKEIDEIVTLVDPDLDDDGIDNTADNCLIDANADQTDTDGDAKGDVCDDTPNGTIDDDSDEVLNDVDNCRSVYNPDQADADGDSIGDVCDPGAITAANTITVHGRVWAQPDLFKNLSWDAINAVCPGGVCGSDVILNGWDVSGWTWASNTDLCELFNGYLSISNLDVDTCPPIELIFSEPFSEVFEAIFERDGWRPTVLYEREITGWSADIEPLASIFQNTPHPTGCTYPACGWFFLGGEARGDADAEVGAWFYK
jgi:Thrombospondin type 3 repeat